MKNILISLLCSICLAISACAIHQIDIQQGNVITPELAAQVKPGMDKKQVVSILGTPLITDTFHHSRWDYIYLLQPHHSGGKTERYHIALFFEGDKLVRIYNDPASTPITIPH